MRLLLSTVVLIALLALTPSATAKEFTFDASADGFTINLPAGWLEIPKADIDNTAQAVSSAVPRARPLLPSYAFQYAHKGKWFTYPYVLVTVRRVGRPSEAALRKLGNASNTALDPRVQHSLARIMTKLKLGQPIFVAKSNTVWLRVSSSVNGYGDISGVLVIVPTSYGIIQFQGYAKAVEFSYFVQTFINMIDTMQFDSFSKY